MTKVETAAPGKRAEPGGGGKLRHVALIVETGAAPRRMMLTGVARYIQEHDPWRIYLKPPAVEKSLPDWLRDWEGDGIIAAVNDPTPLVKPGRPIPVVDVMGLVRVPGVPLVHTNDNAVGRLGAEHLMERGFKNLAFFEFEGQFWSARRTVGFQDAVKERGLTCEVFKLRMPGAGGMGSGPRAWEEQQRQIVEWLATLPKPAGIMATNDLLGQQVLEACQRLRLAVPEQVAVVGADNDECVVRICSPPLSSVIINDHQRGYEAAAVLDRMMRGEAAPSEAVWVEPAGVESRASTDILAIEDEALVRAMKYLREHACDGIGVDDVVRQVPVCRSILERRFRKAVGRSIYAEIVRLRVNRAIELLTDTGLELKVIAEKAGFGTQSYMNVVFRAKVGKTPGSFRKSRPAGAERAASVG